MNKFEIYTHGKTYKNKTVMVKDCFIKFKEITVRDLVIAPFYCNCGYSLMKDLKDHHNINFIKIPLMKDGKKVCEVYKLA